MRPKRQDLLPGMRPVLRAELNSHLRLFGCVSPCTVSAPFGLLPERDQDKNTAPFPALPVASGSASRPQSIPALGLPIV